MLSEVDLAGDEAIDKERCLSEVAACDVASASQRGNSADCCGFFTAGAGLKWQMVCSELY